jgi:hypothetical protein
MPEAGPFEAAPPPAVNARGVHRPLRVAARVQDILGRLSVRQERVQGLQQRLVADRENVHGGAFAVDGEAAGDQVDVTHLQRPQLVFAEPQPAEEHEARPLAKLGLCVDEGAHLIGRVRLPLRVAFFRPSNVRGRVRP